METTGNAETPDEQDKEIDPIITDLKVKQEEMESKINDLRDMNKKRDEELQNIKSTITECKTKVMGIIQTEQTPNNVAPPTSLPYTMQQQRRMLKEQEKSLKSSPLKEYEKNDPYLSTPSMQPLSQNQWRVADIRHIKMIIGVMFLHYTLSHSGCTLTWFRGLFTFIYSTAICYHFVMVTALPLVRGYILEGRMDSGTLQKLDHICRPWYHVIGAAISIIAIQILQMTRCCGWSVTNCIKMVTTVACFLIEFAGVCYPELDYSDSDNILTPMNKLLTMFIMANMLTILIS